MSDEALRAQLVDALRLLAGTCQATADLLAEGKRPPTGWPDMVARRYDMVRNRGTVWTQRTHPAVKR